MNFKEGIYSNVNYDKMCVANSFTLELITTVMSRYGVDYDTVSKVMDITGMWEKLNIDSVACVAAHGDIEEVVESIGKLLRLLGYS